MRKLKGILVLVLLLALVASPITVLASDISGALYYGTIIVSNNSTATTNVAVNCTISTSALIDGGYLNSSANNCVVRSSAGADLPFMPSITGNPWCVWVPSIGENSLLSDILYTAESSGGEIRYFPSAAGMTSSDNANMELGDNFTVEQSGWVRVPNVVADRNLLDFKRANSDWVSIPDHADFSFVTGGVDEPFSIMAWVNLDDATSSRLVSKLTAAKFEWTFYTTGADVLAFLLLNPDGTAQIGRTTGAVTGYQGEWTHFVGTYDGTEATGGINVYINGLEADTGDVIVGAYAGMTDDTAVVELGSRLAGGSEYLDGILGEVKIYSAELTPTEVAADFSGTHKSTDLVAWYELDDGAGNPADSSGNSHDATANTADWITAAGPGGIGTLIGKLGAINATIDSDGDLTTTITGIASTTAPDISSREQTIKTIADSTFFYIEHDTITWDNYAPSRTDLIFNTPLWHAESNGSPFTSKDVNEESCTVAGATWSADGYVFDGADDFIACGNGTQLSFGDGTNDAPFTFHIWVNVTDISANRALLHKEDNGNTKKEYQFVYLNGGTYRLQILDQSVNKAATRAADADPATTGVMTLYSVTYDGGGGATAANGMVLYINGVTVASTATNDALYVAMEPFTDVPLYIGNRVDLDLDLLGLVGEAAIYDIEQTPAEVLAYHDATTWQYDGSTEYFYYQLIDTGVPDTAFDYTYYQNMADYWEYTDIEIGGVQQQRIEWEYDTTFSDLSGNSHDATPTFRTTSSDADVSAVFTSFLPVEEAKAPSYALEDAPAFIETVPTIVSEWGVTPPAGTFPLAGVIAAVANATDTPAQLPLLIIAVFVIIACSLAVSATMRRYGSGSLIVKSLVITALMGVFIAFGNFGIDFWMLFVFLIIAIALSMGSKQVGWQ